MEGYISEIRMFAANFAPRNWAYCAGQIMSIAQNTALFSLLGTTFGGNGVQTFGLPDLRSRVAIGTGQGAGLANITLGEMAGTETVGLSITQMPGHNHTVTGNVVLHAGSGKISFESTPIGNYFANSGADMYNNAGRTAGTNLGQSPANITIGIAGSNQPFPIINPYLGMNYIICLYGIFPSRN